MWMRQSLHSCNQRLNVRSCLNGVEGESEAVREKRENGEWKMWMLGGWKSAMGKAGKGICESEKSLRKGQSLGEGWHVRERIPLYFY